MRRVGEGCDASGASSSGLRGRDGADGVQGAGRPKAKLHGGVGLESSQGEWFGSLGGAVCGCIDVDSLSPERSELPVADVESKREQLLASNIVIPAKIASIGKPARQRAVLPLGSSMPRRASFVRSTSRRIGSVRCSRVLRATSSRLQSSRIHC